jgi:hypothetical protein
MVRVGKLCAAAEQQSASSIAKATILDFTDMALQLNPSASATK